MHDIHLHVIYAWICCPLLILFPQGMMGAYPPYMPMQGPHEGLLSVAPMPPHPVGGPHLPPHHLQQVLPGYPGMLHQGKGCSSAHTCPVTSSHVSPAGGVYLVHRLHSLRYLPSGLKLFGFHQKKKKKGSVLTWHSYNMHCSIHRNNACLNN